jgi:filamentous hemagglutinin family protein
MRRALPPPRLAAALWIALAGLTAHPASAQNQGLVVRDGTLGSAPAGVVPSGPDDLPGTADYLIRADFGEQRGRNLFHSFLRFSIGSGERATFTEQGAPNPGAIENVISRVTGGELSQIDGTLHSTIPGADVWLLNPSGVVFGQGATLDVQGSFHAATGDYVGFEGSDERFYANRSRPSVLSTVRPEAFGFLGERPPAPITVTGSTLENQRTGDTLSLVGGDVVLDGATLEAENGRVNLAAVASAGEVVLAPADAPEPLEMQGFEALGEVRLQASDAVGSLVDVSGEAPGSVFIRGGKLLVQGGAVSGERRSMVRAENESSMPADVPGAGPGLISVAAKESVLVDNGLLSVVTHSAGNAGTIHVASPGGSVTFQRGPGGTPTAVGAGAETTSSGAAGRIQIEARDLLVHDGAALSAPSVGPGASGDGGTVEVVGHSVEVSQNSYIGVATIEGSGNAGSIGIHLGDDGAFLVSGEEGYAWIVAGTFDGAAGNAGDIVIETGSLMVERGAQINVPTTGDGEGGTITIGADAVEISGGGWIGAHTLGKGMGGSIAIDARSVVVGDGSLIRAETTGKGNAGHIGLDVDSLEIQTGGVITTNSRSGGAFGGDAGDIDVTARDSIFLTNLGGPRFQLGGPVSGIFSVTVGGGAAGTITLAAPAITVTEGAIVASSTIGGGAGGDVVLSGDRIRITNGGFVDTTTLPLFDPGGNPLAPGGKAGNVTLDAEQWIQVGGADAYGDPSYVASRSLEQGSGLTDLGDAGDVTLRAPSLLLFDRGSVTTIADQTNGGNITIQAQNLVHLDAGEITSSVSGGAGGNIAIDPVFVILENGSRIEATAVTGHGGAIRITTDNFFAFPGSVVSAKSGDQALSGTVEIHSPDVNLAGSLTPLPSTFLDAASLMRERCAARRSGERAGSFAVRGPGGIPAEPDGWLPAPVLPDPASIAAATPAQPALVASLSGPLLARGACP